MGDLEKTGGLPLFGGGDMARVMSGVKWASTPLGDPRSWPPLLQTLVRVMLSTRFPMWMGWGPDLSFFYNEAYARDTLGVKHPWALARPAREVWSEIWADIGPRIDAVLRTGDATWDEALLLFLERSGYREETYHTFSYSPISDTDGGILGLLCVVSEETSRVIAERRMATIRDLASDISAARTEEAVYTATERQLARNPKDLPFTLTYVFDADGSARLVCSTGIDAGHAAAPARIDPADGLRSWPAGEMASVGTSRIVDDLTGRFGDMPTGAWEEPARQAILVPLSEGGQAGQTGFFVAGLNPYRLVDAGYAGFAELVGGGIAAGLASARAYEAERRRAESLAELDRAKTEFFSNVSHEFRTPLTLIAAPADDALSDDLSPLPDAQRARMEVIQRNARRLRRLVNDMLDFARIEGGRLQAETVPTDLAQYTRDVALSFAPAFERAGLEFVLDLPDLHRAVQIDRDMWEKIVLNLLSNALKFTLLGGVRLGLRDEGAVVVLTVSDTGVGISSDHRAHLFERFYRAPRSAARSHEGTGIGLALVSELAHLHGGEVSVQSEEGAGSTFTVRIPYGTDPRPGSVTGPAAQRESALLAYLDEALQWLDPPAEDGRPTAQVRAVAGLTAAATVLVVDDNPDMRGYLKRILEPYWRVLVASDGAEALEAARSSHPDLVLTDVMMPRLDGFGLLAALRSEPATATTPVVILSARAGEEAAVEGLEAGADDYLVKPFSGLELLARVRSNLELAALRSREAAWRAALVDSLQDAVAVLDAGGSLIEANAAFEQILGYPRDSTPYHPPLPWIYLPEDDPVAAATSREAHGRVMAGERLNAVIPLRHRLGHRLYVSIRANSVGEGEGRRVVVAFHDVTAELAASDRDAALARLGIGLAEASDVREVRDAGITELGRAFGASRVAILAWDGSETVEEGAWGDGPGSDGGLAHEVLTRVRSQSPVVVGADPGRGDQRVARGMGAALDPRQDHRVVWLEFDPPRHVPAEERSLFAILCGYFGQALRRAQLFDDNRTVATAMQRSILGPTAVPPGMAVRYLPAVRPLEVGGDWYDVVELADGRTAVVVGDCTGRGLAAATTMGQLRSACRALLLQANGPADVIRALDVFAERLPGALCTTVFCAVLDDRLESIRYSSAGHLPAVVVLPDGTVSRLDQGQGLPLGFPAGPARGEVDVALPSGSTLVLYTDGLVERRGESLDVGLARLEAAVASRSGTDPERLADELIAALAPPEDQADDIALLVHRRPARREDSPDLELELRAVPAELSAMRRSLRTWLSDRSVGDPHATDVLTAVGEAAANSIEHAYRFSPESVVQITARFRQGKVEVTVVDDGDWKPQVPNPDRGRGLAIMRSLVDEVHVERGGGRTSVRLSRVVGP